MYSERRIKLFAFMSQNMLEVAKNDDNVSEEFIEDMESQHKAYAFLETCNEKDIESLFNSGAFADLCVKYCDKAMEKSGIIESKRQEVLRKLHMNLNCIY